MLRAGMILLTLDGEAVADVKGTRDTLNFGECPFTLGLVDPCTVRDSGAVDALVDATGDSVAEVGPAEDTAVIVPEADSAEQGLITVCACDGIDCNVCAASQCDPVLRSLYSSSRRRACRSPRKLTVVGLQLIAIVR